VKELAMQALRLVARRLGLTRDENGQDLLEYGLLMALIAIVALAAVTSVGRTIYDVFWAAIAAAA
jgi:Flp pilus assembly pilin Flp